MTLGAQHVSRLGKASVSRAVHGSTLGPSSLFQAAPTSGCQHVVGCPAAIASRRSGHLNRPIGSTRNWPGPPPARVGRPASSGWMTNFGRRVRRTGWQAATRKSRSPSRSRYPRTAGRTRTQARVGGPAAQGKHRQAALTALEARRRPWAAVANRVAVQPGSPPHQRTALAFPWRGRCAHCREYRQDARLAGRLPDGGVVGCSRLDGGSGAEPPRMNRR